MKRLLFPALLFLSLPLAAAELAGVKLDDQASVAGKALQLNGIALRTRFVFEVYVAGLYLPEKTGSAEAALAMPGPKRMTLVMRRDVGADQFAGSLMDGLKDNNSEQELAALKPQVESLLAMMQRIGEAKKGMVIDLEYAAPAGTLMKVDGAPQGAPMPGEGFFRALLRIWLGERPVSLEMKKALLGAAAQ